MIDNQFPPSMPGQKHHTALPELYFYGSDHRVIEVKVLEPSSSHQRIPESVVHSLWKNQRFDTSLLKTRSGKPVIVINPGSLNTDSGPDFIDAKIEFDGIVWSGAIELHIYSRYWIQHGHDQDAKYNSTILHVTLFSDHHTGKLIRQDGSTLPELVLYPLLKTPLRKLLYSAHTRQVQSFPCEDQWDAVPHHVKHAWIMHLSRHRLNLRKKEFEHAFLQNPRFEDLLHLMFFKSLGYNKNAEAMKELARRIPLHICREIQTITELEALHFGVAGLLPERRHISSSGAAEYVHLLNDRFDCLQKIYQIPVMNTNSWLFFRLRPANFPTLRIAQAVSLMCNGQLFFHDPIGRLRDAFYHENAFKRITSLLQSTPSPFWTTHYHFQSTAKPKQRVIGIQRIKKLLINTIIPLLLVLADQNNNPALETAIMTLLERIGPEKDHIVKAYEKNGYKPKNALNSQGLHELSSMYCRLSKCLDCNIGKHIIQSHK